MTTRYSVSKATRTVPVSKSRDALIDADLAEEALKYNWSRSDGYACHAKLGMMHRWVMGVGRRKHPGYLVVDHINHDRLDNRRCNLRLVTVQENARNQPTNKKRNPKRTSADDVMVRIMLSRSEKALIKSVSARAGLNMSTWMRHECLRLAKEILQAREKQHEAIPGRST